MNNHKHARLTVHGRVLLIRRVVEMGLRPEEAAHAAGVSVRTAYKWLKRYREEGECGLHNRSSRPHRSPHATSLELQTQIIKKRQARQPYRQISETLGIGHSTVARILKRQGFNRLADLEPAPPIQRYEYPHPGGLLHLDIKKLGRFRRPGHRVTRQWRKDSSGGGWEYVHVAIDDHSRIGFSSIYPGQTGESACLALLQALRYYRTLGIRFERVLTDNGGCYQSQSFQRLCRRLGIKHLRTQPYTPRTNGKAERFIQTALREWAYARSYESSEQRAKHLPFWLHQYNWHRPHASLGYLPPVSRMPSLNNVVGLHR